MNVLLTSISSSSGKPPCLGLYPVFPYKFGTHTKKTNRSSRWYDYTSKVSPSKCHEKDFKHWLNMSLFLHCFFVLSVLRSWNNCAGEYWARCSITEHVICLSFCSAPITRMHCHWSCLLRICFCMISVQRQAVGLSSRLPYSAHLILSRSWKLFLSVICEGHTSASSWPPPQGWCPIILEHNIAELPVCVLFHIQP